MLSIKYSHNESTKDEIRGHLEIMSPYFQPPLAGRCSITDYSLKLFTYAQREEAYCNGSLIGLVAYYIDGKNAYVTNVSVLPKYSRKNIGSTLLSKMESFLIKSGISIVSMEIVDNDIMIAFYRKNGFDLDRQLENGKRRMVKYLNAITPLVSIICLVYNHANYLRECFEGFIMQRVNFPIEILVHDDASTDNSAEIIKDYTDKYPQLFKPIFQTINQYSKGVHISATYQYPRCRGKYIAVCEGDDYWTDPYKLQKQVDFLETNADYSCCFHDAYTETDNNIRKPRWRYSNNTDSSINDIILFGGLFIPTASILMKSDISRGMPNIFRQQHVGDYPLQIYLASVGKVYYMHEAMCVYRVCAANSWSERKEKMSFHDKLKLHSKEIDMLDALDNFYQGKYKALFEKRKKIYLVYACNDLGHFNEARKLIKTINNPIKYISTYNLLMSYSIGRAFLKLLKKL